MYSGITEQLKTEIFIDPTYYQNKNNGSTYSRSTDPNKFNKTQPR